MLLLLLLAVPSRLLLLAGDPPADVQRHFFWDEGLWAHNARVHELRGTWVVDDHNPPLVLAPLYTVSLSAVYRVFGSSLATTRLVSALGGILTCLLLYWALRAVRPPGRALAAALVFTLSYFVVTLQRVAFTEAYQLLWIVLGAGGVLWGIRDPRWAFAGGLGAALAQLVKPSALFLLPVTGGFWCWQRWQDRLRGDAGDFRWAQVGWFSAGGLLVAVPLALLVVPQWDVVWHYLGVSLRSASTLSHTPRVELAGGIFRLPPSGFVLQSVTQVAVVGGFAWMRFLRARDDRPDAVERLAWLWLGLGLLMLGLFQYQPDRRFLALAAPLAILFATATGRGKAEPGAAARVGMVRRALGGAALGFAVGWVVVALGILWLGGAARALWSIVWTLAVAGGAVVSAALPHREVRWTVGVPLVLVVPLFLLLEPARFAWQLSRPSHTIRDATRQLGEFARQLPDSDRVLVGEPGATLALESSILAIPIRDNPGVGAHMNEDAWDRFHPALALQTVPRDRSRAEGGEVARRGFQRCMSFALLPDGKGVPFRRIELWVRGDLVDHCDAAPSAGPPPAGGP